MNQKQILSGNIFEYDGEWYPEGVGFIPCHSCGEMTAKANLRVVGTKQVCIPCSG